MEGYNLVSFAGFFVLLGVAWVLSSNRKLINWRLVMWGTGMQFLFGLFVFVVPLGRQFFWWVNGVVVAVIGAAGAGAEFVFGPLAMAPGTKGSIGFFLAFQVLPTIIFFSALMSILYYWRIMPVVIKMFARAFAKSMKVSGAESVSVASNIFVGVESSLTVKPHLDKMTKSELCTILTAGMATVASNIMALYVLFLADVFPAIAGHMISASIISAPAAIVVSKMLLPESETPDTLGVNIEPVYERESNLFEAILNGSQSGVKLIVGIVALLISVLGLVELVDMMLKGSGGYLNGLFGGSVDLSLKSLLAYVFYPFTLIIGIPIDDAWKVAGIIGERIVLTEVVSYQDLAAAVKSGAIQNKRSLAVTAYALCGFAHLASMAIFVGGIAAIAPKQTTKLSQVGLRALLAATMACLLTGAIAGTFYSESSLLFQ